MIAKSRTEFSPKQRDELLAALRARFEENMGRHPSLVWGKVQARLEARSDKLWSLAEMERPCGEPDVVVQDKASGELIFVDCAPESPAGRLSVCCDREGWLSRKEMGPKTTSMDVATGMGIALLMEEEIKGFESVLTVVGGKIVHAADEFKPHAPPAIPLLPEWSPIKVFGGYGAPFDARKASRNPYVEFFEPGCGCFAFWRAGGEGDHVVLRFAQDLRSQMSGLGSGGSVWSGQDRQRKA